MKTKTTKLKNLLKVLTPNDTAVDFSVFEDEVKKLKDKLTEKITVKTLEDVQVQLERNRKRINFEPLTQAFEKLKSDLAEKDTQLLALLEQKQVELAEAIKQSNESSSQESEILNLRISELMGEIAALQARKVEIPDFGKQIQDAEIRLMKMINLIDFPEYDDKEVKKEIKELEEALKKLRIEMQSRGGGSMNRNIAVGGNTSVLSRYTDLNIRPGSNVTLTYANNNTTKYLDLTIAATGGAGTSRSISTVTVSSVLADTAATDIVVLANGGVRLTLPTAVSNTNLYTVKNIGTSSVLVDTTGGQTIDSDSTVIMPVQYTAVDLISDNSNWHIT